MKGIYFAEGFDLEQKSSGIQMKILAQIKSLKRISTLSVLTYRFKNNFFEKILFILPFIESDRDSKRKLLFEMCDSTIDYIYIRKPSLSVSFYKILKKIKLNYPNVKILMEIPTYPFHNEYKGLGYIMSLKSYFCEKKLSRVIDKILTYSHDKMIWGIPCINMANCVEYEHIPCRSDQYVYEKNVLRITCVAQFNYWHGIDRLINGLNEYTGNYKVILNIVGDGPEIPRLMSMTSDPNVIFHGFKSGEELSVIFEETDIAVDALGRHRSGVEYNSSLKSKEYVARGVPIISAVSNEFDNDKNFRFYYKFPSNDDSIDIQEVVNFFEEIQKTTSAKDISHEIRNYTMQKYDYQYGFLLPLYNELKNCISNN